MQAPRLPLISPKKLCQEPFATDDTPSAEYSIVRTPASLTPAKREVRQVWFQDEELPVAPGKKKQRSSWQICVGSSFFSPRRRDFTVQAEKTPGGSRQVLIDGCVMHSEKDAPLSFSFCKLANSNDELKVEETQGRIHLTVNNVPLKGSSAWTPKARTQDSDQDSDQDC
eukprot:gnl/MRDRNA2_/MRDRNA2_81071_c0_seq1.p1 gnl/MRDRNA2_/MRDRNA2_81071_c0~~gnl/MRDRNA2_/MRDRNA2_81071_c0_seq1.p1  ORF type:complete len:169 (+),score=22.87 gnl/MRDRNA2_/MRDRNA2_81071_c0_seq1:105-611(+)